MKTDDTTNKVRNVMAIVFNLGPENIPDSAHMGEFEPWDSLNHMNILLTLEDEFGIEFTDSEIAQIKSFTELVSVVSEKAQ